MAKKEQKFSGQVIRLATLLKRANFNGRNGSHFFLDLYQDNSQNQNANTSSIRYYAYVGSIGGYSGSGSTSSVYINGQRVGGFSSIGANSNTLIGYLDVTVQHNDEGVGVASYSARADTNWTLGDASISGSFNLPTIQRADSVLSPTTIYVEKTYTLSITQNSSSFTHNITYSCGNKTGIIATGVKSSCSWTVPKELYETFTNYSYAEGKYICQTYSGGTLVGTKETTFYVYADGDLARPTHTFEYNTTDSISSTLTGSSKGIIKGISDISYTITGIPKYGASIKNYYLSTSKKYPEVSNTGTIKAVTSSKYYVSVRDTRYIYSVQTEESLTPFVDYVMLAITDLTLERENELSKNVYINLKGNYFNGNFGTTSNSLTALLYYKESTSNTWSSAITLKPTISKNTFSISNQLVGSIFDYQKDYNFKVVVKDKVFTDESINATKIVTRGVPLLDIGENDILYHGTKIVDYDEDRTNMPAGIMSNYVGYQNETDYYSQTVPLYNVLPMCIKHFSSKEASTNLNDYIHEGIYRLVDVYTNAPINTAIYGVLIVITSTGNDWNVSDMSSWIWQIIINTSGNIYMRIGTNADLTNNWTKLH